MPVREGQRRPDYFPVSEMVVRFDQVNAAQLMIARCIQPGAEQISLVREQQNRPTIESQMNCRAMTRSDGLVGFPDLLSGSRIQANQLAAYFCTEHTVANNHRHARVAENSQRQ